VGAIIACTAHWRGCDDSGSVVVYAAVTTQKPAGRVNFQTDRLKIFVRFVCHPLAIGPRSLEIPYFSHMHTSGSFTVSRLISTVAVDRKVQQPE
jgi:hypothetical protein